MNPLLPFFIIVTLTSIIHPNYQNIIDAHEQIPNPSRKFIVRDQRLMISYLHDGDMLLSDCY